MKISYELEQGYIDVWNEESGAWDRYIKVNKESVVEEKKIPEKIEQRLLTDDGLPVLKLFVNQRLAELTYVINSIIDYLKSKGDK